MRCLHCHLDGIPLGTEVCPQCGIVLSLLLRDVLPPDTVLGGVYHIDYALGQGGFGITYRGMHVKLEQPVAIKEYYPRECASRDPRTGWVVVAEDKQDTYNEWLGRFIEEGRTLCRVNHPNVVKAWNLFEERGTAYLVMELLKGDPLSQAIERGRGFSRTQIESLINQVVEALEAIHAVGVYHLDLKPDNVIVLPGNRPVLIDFGAARQRHDLPKDITLTLEYAAPEVISGDEVGPESDLFELGMMLHELLTGERPPTALARLSGIESEWEPTLAEPWKTLLKEALCLCKEKRPSSVRGWWDSRKRTLDGSCAASSPPLETWVQCPYPGCNFEFLTRPGSVVCEKCGWKFVVTAQGRIIEGLPIQAECPWCRCSFLAEKAGQQACPHCGRRFEIDRYGKVIGGGPISVKCPDSECGSIFPVDGAGECICPQCGWRFSVNQHGDLIAGRPIKFVCPSCWQKSRTDRPGEKICASCHLKFYVDQAGRVENH